MDNDEISINRIDLRSRGISTDIVRSALDGLDREVMNNLAQQGLLQSGKRIQLGDLNLGNISLPQGGDARELRREIARAMTQEISARIRRK